MSCIRIVSRQDPTDVHTIDVTHHIGTTNYDRALTGIYAKVDFDRYWVDSDEADAAHAKAVGEVTL